MDADFSMFNSVLNAQANQGVFANFYDKYVKTGKILDNGLPEYVVKTYINIRVKDTQDEAVHPADREDMIRFPREYELYKLKKEKAKQGTPLQMFAFLTIAQIDCCNTRGVFTVEELAKLTLEQAKSINLVEEVEMAKTFLKASKNNKCLSEYQAEIKRLKDEIAKLKEQLELKDEHSTNSTRGS